MSLKILITDDVNPLLIKGFEARGYHCDFRPEITFADTLNCIHDYDGLVVNSKIFVFEELLSRAPKLRFVARLGSGLEIIDLKACAEHQVVVIASPEGNRQAVGEHALGMLLTLARQIPKANVEIRQRIWAREARRGWELQGKTVGLIGFGHTGRSFARVLAGFGVKLLIHDKYLPQGYAAQDFPDAIETDLNTLLAESDVVSLHLPLTSEVKHYADASFFASCKAKAVVINTSRGMVLNTRHLLDALHSGHLAGACLDVFENEKAPTYSEEEAALYDELFALDNVVLTPHIAGWTHESKRKMAEVILEKYDSLFVNR